MGSAFSCSSHGAMLLVAASSGDLRAVQKILKSHPEAASYHTFKELLTPLSVASSHGHHIIVQSIVEAAVMLEGPERAKKLIIDHVSSKGMTALMLACKHGHPQVVEVLVTNGADIRRVDRHRRNTALHWAAMYGHANCIARVLTHYASLKPSLLDDKRVGAHGVVPNSTVNGHAVLAHIDHVTVPCSHNSPSNEPNGSPLVTSPLSVVAANDEFVDLHNAWGMTALHIAACQGSSSTVKALLRHGAGLWARTIPPTPSTGSTGSQILRLPAGSTALHLAAAGNHVSVIRVLLEAMATEVGVGVGAGMEDMEGMGQFSPSWIPANVSSSISISPPPSSSPPPITPTPPHLPLPATSHTLAALKMDLRSISNATGHCPRHCLMFAAVLAESKSRIASSARGRLSNSNIQNQRRVERMYPPEQIQAASAATALDVAAEMGYFQESEGGRGQGEERGGILGINTSSYSYTPPALTTVLSTMPLHLRPQTLHPSAFCLLLLDPRVPIFLLRHMWSHFTTAVIDGQAQQEQRHRQEQQQAQRQTQTPRRFIMGGSERGEGELHMASSVTAATPTTATPPTTTAMPIITSEYPTDFVDPSLWPSAPIVSSSSALPTSFLTVKRALDFPRGKSLAAVLEKVRLFLDLEVIAIHQQKRQIVRSKRTLIKLFQTSAFPLEGRERKERGGGGDREKGEEKEKGREGEEIVEKMKGNKREENRIGKQDEKKPIPLLVKILAMQSSRSKVNSLTLTPHSFQTRGQEGEEKGYDVMQGEDKEEKKDSKEEKNTTSDIDKKLFTNALGMEFGFLGSSNQGLDLYAMLRSHLSERLRHASSLRSLATRLLCLLNAEETPGNVFTHAIHVSDTNTTESDTNDFGNNTATFFPSSPFPSSPFPSSPSPRPSPSPSLPPPSPAATYATVPPYSPAPSPLSSSHPVSHFLHNVEAAVPFVLPPPLLTCSSSSPTEASSLALGQPGGIEGSEMTKEEEKGEEEDKGRGEGRGEDIVLEIIEEIDERGKEGKGEFGNRDKVGEENRTNGLNSINISEGIPSLNENVYPISNTVDSTAPIPSINSPSAGSPTLDPKPTDGGKKGRYRSKSGSSTLLQSFFQRKGAVNRTSGTFSSSSSLSSSFAQTTSSPTTIAASTTGDTNVHSLQSTSPSTSKTNNNNNNNTPSSSSSANYDPTVSRPPLSTTPPFISSSSTLLFNAVPVLPSATIPENSGPTRFLSTNGSQFGAFSMAQVNHGDFGGFARPSIEAILDCLLVMVVNPRTINAILQAARRISFFASVNQNQSHTKLSKQNQNPAVIKEDPKVTQGDDAAVAECIATLPFSLILSLEKNLQANSRPARLVALRRERNREAGKEKREVEKEKREEKGGKKEKEEKEEKEEKDERRDNSTPRLPTAKTTTSYAKTSINNAANNDYTTSSSVTHTSLLMAALLAVRAKVIPVHIVQSVYGSDESPTLYEQNRQLLLAALTSAETCFVAASSLLGGRGGGMCGEGEGEFGGEGGGITGDHEVISSTSSEFSSSKTSTSTVSVSSSGIPAMDCVSSIKAPQDNKHSWPILLNTQVTQLQWHVGAQRQRRRAANAALHLPPPLGPIQQESHTNQVEQSSSLSVPPPLSSLLSLISLPNTSSPFPSLTILPPQVTTAIVRRVATVATARAAAKQLVDAMAAELSARPLEEVLEVEAEVGVAVATAIGAAVKGKSKGKETSCDGERRRGRARGRREGGEGDKVRDMEDNAKSSGKIREEVGNGDYDSLGLKDGHRTMASGHNGISSSLGVSNEIQVIRHERLVEADPISVDFIKRLVASTVKGGEGEREDGERRRVIHESSQIIEREQMQGNERNKDAPPSSSVIALSSSFPPFNSHIAVDVVDNIVDYSPSGVGITPHNDNKALLQMNGRSYSPSISSSSSMQVGVFSPVIETRPERKVGSDVDSFGGFLEPVAAEMSLSNQSNKNEIHDHNSSSSSSLSSSLILINLPFEVTKMCATEGMDMFDQALEAAEEEVAAEKEPQKLVAAVNALNSLKKTPSCEALFISDPTLLPSERDAGGSAEGGDEGQKEDVVGEGRERKIKRFSEDVKRDETRREKGLCIEERIDEEDNDMDNDMDNDNDNDNDNDDDDDEENDDNDDDNNNSNNEREQEEDVCGICLDDEVAILMAGCKHGVCVSCAWQMSSKGVQAPNCPFCRRPIGHFEARWGDGKEAGRRGGG